MATKSAFPNRNKTRPVVGKKDNSGKSALPNQPHQPQVKLGSKTGVPNTGSGKVPGKMTGPAPSVKAPVSAGAAKSNVDGAKVGGLLGRLAVGRVGR